ncbi:MAG: DEAD/DEAH box helicase [Pseudomonas sp.]
MFIRQLQWSMNTNGKADGGILLEGSEGFARLGLRSELLRAINELEFSKPTAVQRDAIPPGLAGRDVLACASTGSGKTAAFLLPIMQQMLERPARGTRALVLVPTRELAVQVAEHFNMMARFTRLRCAAVYGGVGMRPQEQALRTGADLIVATPGRLLDHMQRDYASMPALELLVLDEADRMLDMGFLPDIRRILRALPQRARQTLFFSATLPPAIVQLSGELLQRPVRISVERKSAPAQGITQALYPVHSRLKVDLLVELLKRGTVADAIVFCRTKHRANRLAEKLERQGFATARMHGNRSQTQRTEALGGFKSGRYRLLVATDIVARGIDVEALSHVINFDVPAAPDDYIHRVGRTARAEATGDAYTLVAPDEENEVRAIERSLGQRIERRTLKGFDYQQVKREDLEVPLAQRIAAIRSHKADERKRAAANRERKGNRLEQERTSAEARRGANQRRQHGPKRVATFARSGGGK